MPDVQTLGVYFTAALVLAITPGPGIFYVLTRSIRGGRSEGYASAFGTAIGGSLHVMAAALGLSAVLATSAVAFNLIKYLGAAYLIYLGIKTILSKEMIFAPEAGAAEADMKPDRAMVQGIITEVLNPKTALFFLAFIPQFIDPAGPVVLQFLVLGGISVCLNTSADLVVATLAGPIATQLKQRASLRRVQRMLTGGGLIALGAYVATAGAEQQ